MAQRARLGLALGAALTLLACGGSQAAPETAADESANAPSDSEAAPSEPEETWGSEDGEASPATGSQSGATPSSSAGEASPTPAADSGATETRTTAVIQEVVQQNRAKVRACYDTAQKKLPDLKGDLVLRFTLNPDGAVKSIEQDLDKSTLKSPEVVKCAIDEIKSWKFPPSSRGMDTTVNYPFNFNPKK